MTKSKFLIIALAAACLEGFVPAGRCQVIGYLPVSITVGYNFVANPLDTGDNSLASVVSPSSPPLGTSVFLWNATNQQFDAPAIYSASGWSSNMVVAPGTGFVIRSSSGWTLTLIGNLLEGSHTNFYPGGNRLSLLASSFPTSDALTGSTMTFPGIDSQNVFLYNSTNQNFLDPFTYFANYGWFDPAGAAGPSGPVIKAAQCFFAQNPGTNTSWVQTTGIISLTTSQSGVNASIQSARVAGGKVTLSILNPGGAAYSVQFSADRSLWTTLAAKQIGPTWTGSAPAGPQGFYRLANP